MGGGSLGLCEQISENRFFPLFPPIEGEKLVINPFFPIYPLFPPYPGKKVPEVFTCQPQGEPPTTGGILRPQEESPDNGEHLRHRGNPSTSGGTPRPLGNLPTTGGTSRPQGEHLGHRGIPPPTLKSHHGP